jgi:sugar phosphate isomerase/epimerase
MQVPNRRAFLVTSAQATLAAALAPHLGAKPLGLPIGSQTYPHRARIKDGDFAGLLKDMKGIGIETIELCSPGYAEFASLSDGKQTRKIIEDAGLNCRSAHFNLPSLRTKQPEMIAWAKDIGMTQMSTATLSGAMKDGVTTMDAIKKAADEYNKIGAEAAKAGLQQVLHNEGFELAKVEGDPRFCYDVLLELLDPKLVKMQFQMSTTRVLGDPVNYFRKYPGRFISMHLQGVNLTSPTPPPPAPGQGRGPGLPQKAVGKDDVDWKKIFTAAKQGGVKNYFVEQAWDLTVQSVDYLKTLNV